jgi:hypothetical protein
MSIMLKHGNNKGQTLRCLKNNNLALKSNRRFGEICCLGKIFVSGFNTLLSALQPMPASRA